MRLSELLNLKFKDVDFKAKLIRIWENKADHPRAVPMTSRVLNILTKRKEETWYSKPFRLSIDQVEKLWKKVRKQLKMTSDPEFVIHALRHTCACRLIRKGVNLVQVQRWLGHKSIKTTERYVHVIPQDLLDVVERLEG
jgi:integrase